MKRQHSRKSTSQSAQSRTREVRERALVEPVVKRGGAEVGWALRGVLARYSDVVRLVAERVALSVGDLTALELLMNDPALGPADLAQRLGITSASATVLVDRLEQAGHLSRKAHAHDRRRRTLEVTPHAEREMLGALAPLFSALERHDQSFSQQKQALIEKYLRGVEAVYDAFIGED
jgi:DNA-binding MarR family transcriptional regulator